MNKDTASIKIEELEKRLYSITKNQNSYKLEIDNMNNNIQNIANFKFYDSIKFFDKRWGVGSVRHDRIFFLCKPHTLTKIKIKANIFFISSKEVALTPYFRVLLNNLNLSTGIIYEKKYSISQSGTYEYTIDFDYDFYPIKEDNTFQILTHAGTTDYLTGTSGITKFEVTIFGTDISIINRRNDLRLFITKDNYYLTKQTETACEYLCTPTNNVNINGVYTKSEKLNANHPSFYNRIHPFNYFYLPRIEFDTSTNKFICNNSIPYFYHCYSMNSVMYLGKENLPDGEIPLLVGSFGPTYTVGHPMNDSDRNTNLGVSNTNNDCALCYAKHDDNGVMKNIKMQLNGVNVPGIWVDNCCVFAKDWEDHQGLRPNCYVATNSLGEIYFLPAENSDYSVYVGKGHQVNAYMQSDLSINVYRRWHNNVYKNTLVYNSDTERYELSNALNIFENSIEFFEGYNNDYFINKLGTWEYIKG